MAERYTIQHIDELEHPWPKWILARKSLGITAFGMNVCELQPGESIPEHDERARDQEEVFLTLSGSPPRRASAPEGSPATSSMPPVSTRVKGAPVQSESA